MGCRAASNLIGTEVAAEANPTRIQYLCAILANIMSLPMKVVIGLSSFAFQKFLDRYGEEIVAYASRRGEEVVREYGPQAVRWTAETGSNAYARVAPHATSAVSKLSAITGRSAKGAIIPGADEPETGRLSTMVFGPFAGDLSRIGAYVRAVADQGADQLRNLSDEQIGAIAVGLWRAQNRDSLLGRRLRRMFWKESG